MKTFCKEQIRNFSNQGLVRTSIAESKKGEKIIKKRNLCVMLHPSLLHYPIRSTVSDR